MTAASEIPWTEQDWIAECDCAENGVRDAAIHVLDVFVDAIAHGKPCPESVKKSVLSRLFAIQQSAPVEFFRPAEPPKRGRKPIHETPAWNKQVRQVLIRQLKKSFPLRPTKPGRKSVFDELARRESVHMGKTYTPEKMTQRADSLRREYEREQSMKKARRPIHGAKPNSR